MTSRLCAVLFFVFSGLVAAGVGDPPRSDWPVAPAPKVVPEVMPGSVDVLPVGKLYVIQSDEDVQLLVSPPGIVSFTHDPGPIRIHGEFVDGKGRESRVYAKKNVFTVERNPGSSGPVELFLVPKGKVERRVVGDGGEPAPPPKPKPEPKPPEVKAFRVVFVVESGDKLSSEQTSVIYGKTVEDFLNGKCTGGRKGWFRRDKDGKIDQLDATMKALWSSIQSKVTTTPCVAIAVNENVDIVNLESTQAAMVAKFKEYLGEK